MKFYEHHIGDYQSKTAHLSLAEHGAYSLMLQAFYASEKPLPADTRVLYRLLRANSAAERKAIDSVVNQFWIKESNGLVNQRAVGALASYHEWVERQRAAGRASGVKRSFNHRSTDVQPSLNQTTNQNSTKNEPLTSHSDTHLDTHPHSDSGAAPNGSRVRVGSFEKAGSGWKPPTEEEIRAGK